MGQIQNANAIGTQVGACIIKNKKTNNTAQLKSADEKVYDSEMSKKVKQLTSGSTTRQIENDVTADDLNQHYASILLTVPMRA